MDRRTHISPHFRWEEALVTDHTSLQRAMNRDEKENARILAVSVLEPLRAAIKAPITTISWFRSGTLNRYVGGANASLHLEALACDFRCRVRRRSEVWDAITEADWPFTAAIIYEATGHIHIGYRWYDAKHKKLLLFQPAGQPGQYLSWTEDLWSRVE